MYLPSKWPVLGLNLIQAWLFFFFFMLNFCPCTPNIHYWDSKLSHLSSWDYFFTAIDATDREHGAAFIVHLTSNKNYNIKTQSSSQKCAQGMQFFFCFFFWTVSSILSSNFIFSSVFGCIASAKEFLKPVEWKYWSRQRDGRTDRRKGRRNGGRAERGKDGWGGDERRREVARVMDSHTQCKGGKTEGRIAKKKERRKKGVSVFKEEA